MLYICLYIIKVQFISSRLFNFFHHFRCGLVADDLPSQLPNIRGANRSNMTLESAFQSKNEIKVSTLLCSEMTDDPQQSSQTDKMLVDGIDTYAPSNHTIKRSLPLRSQHSLNSERFSPFLLRPLNHKLLH